MFLTANINIDKYRKKTFCVPLDASRGVAASLIYVTVKKLNLYKQ